MEYRAGGVEGLKLILNIECGEDIIGVVDRQMGTVGIIGSAAGLRRSDDAGVVLSVILCKTVGGRFRGSRFEIEQLALVHLLIIGQPVAHMVEDLLGEFLSGGVAEITPDPVSIEARFIHADKTDRGEMVVK